MSTLLVVFLKELFENARDRRAMLSALLLGPIGAPLLFTLMMHATLDRQHDAARRPLVLAVAGIEHAPNLVDYLRREGVDVRPFRGDAEAAARAVREHERPLVLAVPADVGERLRTGMPATIALYCDTSDSAAATDHERAVALLRAWSSRIAAWRLEARGLSPNLIEAVVVDEIDVATAVSRSVALLGMLSYFILFATLVGGLYLAIDATAGERERGSLEPLLALPVPRSTLVIGKILATSAWMVVSLALAVTAFGLSLRFVRLDLLGMRTNLGPAVGLEIVLVMLPFVPLGAGLMTLVASFTRTYREAQSWLTAVLLIPTAPIMFAAVYQLAPRPGLMWIPSLSQHLLINALLKGAPLPASAVALSAFASLAVAGLFAWLTIRSYARERILG